MKQWRQDFNWLKRNFFHAHGSARDFASELGVTTESLRNWDGPDGKPNAEHQRKIAQLRAKYESGLDDGEATK